MVCPNVGRMSLLRTRGANGMWCGAFGGTVHEAPMWTEEHEDHVRLGCRKARIDKTPLRKMSYHAREGMGLDIYQTGNGLSASGQFHAGRGIPTGPAVRKLHQLNAFFAVRHYVKNSHVCLWPVLWCSDGLCSS